MSLNLVTNSQYLYLLVMEQTSRIRSLVDFLSTFYTKRLFVKYIFSVIRKKLRLQNRRNLLSKWGLAQWWGGEDCNIPIPFLANSLNKNLHLRFEIKEHIFRTQEAPFKGNVTSFICNIGPYWTFDLLTFRPTAISYLRQLFIFVLFKG